MKRYTVYHKFAGYVADNGLNYTDDISTAKQFNSIEDAENDITTYLECVEEIT